MTRKLIPLMVLAGVVLVSGAFGGCTKKPDQITSLQLQNENLKGQLQGAQRRQEALQEEKQMLSRELTQVQGDLDDKDAEIRDLQEQGGTIAPSAGIRDVIEIPGTLSFKPGSADLTSSGKQQLSSIASKIRSRYPGNHISVEGHTDSSPLVKTKEQWKRNVWLSANRAWAVADYLINQGVAENMVSVVGHGAAHSKGGSAADDRRVEIVVLSQ